MKVMNSIVLWNYYGTNRKLFPSLVRDLWRKFFFFMLVLLKTTIGRRGDQEIKILEVI